MSGIWKSRVFVISSKTRQPNAQISAALLIWFLRISSGDRKSVSVGSFFGGVTKKYAVQVSIVSVGTF